MRFASACAALTASASIGTVVMVSSSSPSSTTRASMIFERSQQGRSLSSLSKDVNNVRREKRLSSLLMKQKQKHVGGGLDFTKEHRTDGGMLRNVHHDGRQQCNPSVAVNSNKGNNEPDIGVLSCGLGQYCSASSESPMGGFCVRERSAEKDLESTETSEAVRELQVINDVIDFCQGSSSMAIGKAFDSVGQLTCQSCEVDAVEYTGKINCTYTESCYVLGGLCPEDTDMTTFCETTSVEANLTGPEEYSYRICYNLHKPTNWTYCVTYKAAAEEDTTCEIDINGTMCNSCTFRGTNCREFDCENTVLGKSSTTCGYSLMEAFTSSYLYEQLPCSGGCNLCPDGEVMGDPDDSFVTSTGSVSNCFVAQLSALTGEFSNSECSAEKKRVTNCECDKPNAPTEAPAESSTTPGHRSYKSMIGFVSILASSSLMAFIGLTVGI